jgi:hypothetical protein
MNENIAEEGMYYCTVCEEQKLFTYRWERRTLQQALNFESPSPSYGLCCTTCQTPITEI